MRDYIMASETPLYEVYPESVSLIKERVLVKWSWRENSGAREKGPVELFDSLDACLNALRTRIGKKRAKKIRVTLDN